MRTALTIAGSDSGGGAGIQADLKTFAAFGVFGTSAVTAVTAQNTRGVSNWLALPASLVAEQIEAVVSDIGADATKIGMLATADIARQVASSLERHSLKNVVLDTVMVAKGGARLLNDDAVAVIRERLLGLATIVTVNVPEAEALVGIPVTDVAGQQRAAERLMQLGARAVVVKGGHLDGPAVDVLHDGRGLSQLVAERIATRHTHGTGCTFASAIAAGLALGHPLDAAVREAKTYVTGAIRHAPNIGQGHGPLQHFWR